MRFIVILLLAGLRMDATSHPDWADLRKQIKKTLHVPENLPALQDKRYGQFTVAAGVVADRVAFTTDYDLRVPAIIYHQTGATILKHPALIIVNGHGGDKASWYASWAGILYARAGGVVLTYDPIGEFERNKEKRSATNQHDEFIAPEEMALRMTGLMVTDILQGSNYLKSRKDVDDKRIGVLAFSMGSFIGSLACAVSTDVHACVLVGGGDLDGPGGYWDSSSKKMCQSTAYKALSFLGDRGATIFALNAKRGPTMVWNGTADKSVDIVHHERDFFEQLRKDTEKTLGSSKDVFDFGFTPDGGHQPYFLAKEVTLWLNEKLKFPDWSKKQIEAMPETNTSKDGKPGMMALGNDIPTVLRDQLQAVPDVVWTAEQDNFVYESWVDRAKHAVSAGAP